MTVTRLKRLPEKLRKNGFSYNLIERNDERAIYSQTNDFGAIIAYEVFKIRKGVPHPQAVEDLKNFDLIERFPGDNDFGKSAHSFANLDDAKNAFISK